jgi:hypothetical protein
MLKDLFQSLFRLWSTQLPSLDENSRFKISFLPPRIEAAGDAVNAVTRPSVLIPIIFGMVAMAALGVYLTYSRGPAAFSYIESIITSILGRAFS